ncbi:hypothetical protein HDF19_03760 [Mucilaginibacter sp. E4BP6]|uniref:hypothetical protein n=1 Tax=Mucilaginibacter sp. E4BP6 TaxID=2723089 RepID=UPI0015C803E0|nr:hypothetical protein [Mucilaginibacter sp. E4BP6]NYE64585.1 hypothetical protein [Mucilaginibacter sp. E4BP6]
MKKILVFLLLIAASTQLKAQSLQTSPDLKLNDGLQNAFKPKADPLPQLLLSQPKGDLTNNTANVYSYMPVAKLSSTDKMPVATLARNGVSYTMLVKREKVINPAEQPLIQPLP